MPSVLPTKIPTLLVNGSAGIAVGMATNIAPHNLGEALDALIAMMDNIKDKNYEVDKSDLTTADLMQYIKGPDFPTGGIINGTAGIINAYNTGKGRVIIRSKSHIENFDKGREALVLTEIPYQVNKAKLIEKIADLIKEKIIESVSALRDESDKDGMRIVLELKKGENADILLNNLFAHTQAQSSFSINNVALVEGKPETLTLKRMLEVFLKHRVEVVTRRTEFELRKAREKNHILEGLIIALDNIDAVITLIKSSKNTAEAKEKLMTHPWDCELISDMLFRAQTEPTTTYTDGKYYLSEAQTSAILEMRLHRLTSLEVNKLIEEFQLLLELIAELLLILSSKEKLMSVIKEEFEAIKKQYADDRRSEIALNMEEIDNEDLIPKEEKIVTISHVGYAKAQLLAEYKAQNRGGRGKTGTTVNENDFVEHLIVANSHDTLLLFSNFGLVYSLRVFEIPEAGRTAKGRPLVNMLPLVDGEKITTILTLPSSVKDISNIDPDSDAEVSKAPYIFLATRNGIVKKTSAVLFSKIRKKGLKAVVLEEGDALIGAGITDGSKKIFLLADNNKAVVFKEENVRSMGRNTRGVKGMNLTKDENLIQMLIVDDSSEILTLSEKGKARRTPLESYRETKRGSKGVLAVAKNTKAVGAVLVNEEDDVMLITNQGTIIRTSVNKIAKSGKTAQGVNLIKLQENENLTTIATVQRLFDEESDEIEGLTID
jgi:DNA gyrase subunit A